MTADRAQSPDAAPPYPSMWSANDESLVAGIAAGDSAAMTALVRRYQRRVYGLARLVLTDPTAAEDVAQEAFLRVWRHAETYDPRRASVTSWLLTITRNLAIDAVRLRRAEPTDPAAMLALQLPDPARSPEDRAAGAEDVRRVRAALRDLPVEQARAVVRATFLGQTAAEIAAIESIPLGTAKTRVRTGLGRLRAALAEDGARP